MPIPPNGPNGRVPPAECSVSGQEITTLGSDLTTIMLTINYIVQHLYNYPARNTDCAFPIKTTLKCQTLKGQFSAVLQ